MLAGTLVTVIGFLPVGFARSTAGEYAGNIFWIVGFSLIASTGGLFVRAPAARLNGLVPNTPKWTSGNLECRAEFELRPPAKPVIRWSIRGTGIDGTMQGLTHPVRGLQFDIQGNDVSAEIRSLRAGVGSSTLNLTGTLARGKPLSTGTFHIAVDRMIAEEWAP